jgi:hypothetical protein
MAATGNSQVLMVAFWLHGADGSQKEALKMLGNFLQPNATSDGQNRAT